MENFVKMWFVVGILILLAFFYGIMKISQIFHKQIEFILKGLDFGFSFSEIKLLWETSKKCSLDNPISIYISTETLNKCIYSIKSSAENSDSDDFDKTQKILSKLYQFKAKIDNESDKKRGLESTKSLENGQKLRIILPQKGVFSSEILNNGSQIIIKVPTQKDQITVEGKDWVNQTISVYLWRKEDARYVFDTSVAGCGIFLGKAAIFLNHSNNLVRTQKRNAVRAKCDLEGKLFILKKDQEIDYNAVENTGGYRCKIEDISEKGALIRTASKGLSNMNIKIQFQLDNRLIIMFGIVRTVEYNESLNQSRLHFECIHIDSLMKNYVLSYVYKILPQNEKDIFEAQKLIDKDEELSPTNEENNSEANPEENSEISEENLENPEENSENNFENTDSEEEIAENSVNFNSEENIEDSVIEDDSTFFNEETESEKI